MNKYSEVVRGFIYHWFITGAVPHVRGYGGECSLELVAACRIYRPSEPTIVYRGFSWSNREGQQAFLTTLTQGNYSAPCLTAWTRVQAEAETYARRYGPYGVLLRAIVLPQQALLDTSTMPTFPNHLQEVIVLPNQCVSVVTLPLPTAT